MSERRVRAPIVRIVDHGDATTVIGPARTRRYDGDTAALLRAVLEIHAAPVTRTELFAQLAELAGDVPAEPVDQLIAILVDDGVLVEARPPVPHASLGARRVVLGVTGAIAAVDAPALVRGLQAIGCEVRVAMTAAAREFVAPGALDALTHHAVWTDLWQRDARTPVPHINLAEWAELVVVCPASATSIARIATGDCSELVAAIATATRAPVVIVPSMNDAMYDAPAVQTNLATLRAHGRWLVHPALGVEVAHRPDARHPMLGPAPPAHAVVDIVRHILRELAPRARLPDGAAGWEQLWATTPADQLPWRSDSLDAALASAVERVFDRVLGRVLDREPTRGPRRLLDLGTGDGAIAIGAAHRGFRVTAVDIAPSALGRARDRAGELPITWVLDDICAPRIDGTFDVAVDNGLLHCLPRASWPAYARAVTSLVAPGGELVVVAHAPGSELGTTPVGAGDLRALLPAFELGAATPGTFSRAPAHLFELRRMADR